MRNHASFAIFISPLCSMTWMDDLRLCTTRMETHERRTLVSLLRCSRQGTLAKAWLGKSRSFLVNQKGAWKTPGARLQKEERRAAKFQIARAAARGEYRDIPVLRRLWSDKSLDRVVPKRHKSRYPAEKQRPVPAGR